MAIKNREVTVLITLTTEMLGTVPKDKEIYKTFIESKKPATANLIEEDESLTVADDEKGITGFHSDEKGVFIYDYLFKGFMKAALQALKNIEGTDASAIRQNLKTVNNWIFVEPRRVYLELPRGEGLGNLQRPLRAQTALGERIALAHSETVPEGTTFKIKIRWYECDGLDIHVIKDILDYGADKALGQWRNAGYGRFSYFMTDYKEVNVSQPWDKVADFEMPPKAGVKQKPGKKAASKEDAELVLTASGDVSLGSVENSGPKKRGPKAKVRD